jgi:adenylate kinase
MDAGELIPDEVVLGMVDERLDQDNTRSRGFILDGFPRTVVQAEKLDELLAPLELDLVINLDVPTNSVMRRLASRRVCVDCGANYSTQKPPKVGWICDICSGEVIQREDDTEAAIKRRLDVYEEQTAPLIDRYRQLGKLAMIAGMGTMDAVTARLIAVVDRRLGNSRGSM